MKRVIALVAAFGMAVAAVPFTNEILAGDTLARNAMQSEGFQSGVQGWRVERNGDAEFNNLIARGTFVSGDGTGQHIEIANNLIEFYTGGPDEAGPGVIEGIYDSGSNFYQVAMRSPDVIGASSAGFYVQADATTGDGIAFVDSPIFQVNSLDFELIGTNVIDTPESWHNLGLVNSWATLGGLTPQYRINVAGDVVVRGRVSSGTTGVIGTLPVGYRPTQLFDVALKSNGDAASVSWLQVSTAGVITVVGNVAAAQTWLTLNFSFSARS